MAITSITRDFADEPNIVRIVTTDVFATITTAGYLTAQQANIRLLNNGDFEWAASDYVLISYSGGIGFFTVDLTTEAFVAGALIPGSLSDTLPSGDLFVGSAGNVATAVAMSGDATMANTGALTVATNAITYTKLAASVLKQATVALTAAQIKALYDTPVQLIAAGGAGTLILIDSIVWDIAFGAAQYTAGGAIAAQYGNTVHGAGPAASGSLAAASLNAVAASGFLSNGGIEGSLNVTQAASLNTAVYLSNDTADFATGDSTATLYINYRIITPA